MNNPRSRNWQKKKIEEALFHQRKAFHAINDSVVLKRERGRKIYLENNETLLDFASCSYLGLDMDERIIKASQSGLEDTGINFAIARTRLRMKNFDILDDLLSKILCNSFVQTFTSLHITHLGFIPLLSSGKMPSFPIKEKGLIYILDKTAHASIQINRGLMEQFGQVRIVNFQDKVNLYKAFKSAYEDGLTPISFSDSIGSMGGVAPILELFEYAEEFNGYVYFDDAHGSSIYGKNGCGYVLDCLQNKFHPRLILASSLSKGFGTNASVLALPTKEDHEMVKLFCAPYLFSNPPANSVVNAAIASAQIHLTPEIEILQKQLWENTAYLEECLSKHVDGTKIINQKEKIPIRGVFIGEEEDAIMGCSKLRKNGYFILTAMYPTVAKGKSMFRIAVSAEHKKEDIFSLCYQLKSIIDNLVR